MNKFTSVLKLVFIYGFFIFLIGGVSYWIWKNPIYNPAGAQVQKPVSDIEVRFSEVIVKGRKEGVPHWTLYCKNVDVERNSPFVFFKDRPKGEFYNLKDWSKKENTNPGEQNNDLYSGKLRSFKWEAERAEYNTDNEDLTLFKDVLMTTDEQDKIETQELYWNSLEEKASTPIRTKITAGKGFPLVETDKLNADIRFDILELKGNVEITTELSEEQEL